MTAEQLAALIQKAAKDQAKSMRDVGVWEHTALECMAMEKAAEALEGFADNLAASLVPKDAGREVEYW